MDVCGENERNIRSGSSGAKASRGVGSTTGHVNDSRKGFMVVSPLRQLRHPRFAAVISRGHLAQCFSCFRGLLLYAPRLIFHFCNSVVPLRRWNGCVSTHHIADVSLPLNNCMHILLCELCDLSGDEAGDVFLVCIPDSLKSLTEAKNASIFSLGYDLRSKIDVRQARIKALTRLRRW